VSLMRHAKRVGADAALVVTPYYNKPSQRGLYHHYKTLHDAVDLPIIIYNIPGRSVIDMTPATMGELAKLPRIIGVKDATGDISRVSDQRIACGPDFSVLSGDDNLTLPLMAVGGRGVISVIANLVPKETAELTHAALSGDWKRARDLHHRLYPLSRAAFLETNPIPIKEAMAMLGMLEPEFRLPMCRMSDANREKLRGVLRLLGLLKG